MSSDIFDTFREKMHALGVGIDYLPGSSPRFKYTIDLLKWLETNASEGSYRLVRRLVKNDKIHKKIRILQKTRAPRRSVFRRPFESHYGIIRACDGVYISGRKRCALNRFEMDVITQICKEIEDFVAEIRD